MELKAFDKVILDLPFDNNLHGQVIGIKTEKDSSRTYVIAQRRKNFGSYVRNATMLRVNSKEIDQGTIKLKIHTV